MDPSNVLGHCHSNGWLSLPHNRKFATRFAKSLQEGKRGATGNKIAMVCCDWRFQLPSAVSLVCSMDPRNVLGHCHSNGWLSLPHNRKFATRFAKSLQEGKRGATGNKIAKLCCDWQCQLPSTVSLVCSMDPGNVLGHCHINGWLSLPHTRKFATRFAKSLQEGKRGATGNKIAKLCCDWQFQLPSAVSLVCSMDPGNVLGHCHINGWLSLPHNRKFATRFAKSLQEGDRRGTRN